MQSVGRSRLGRALGVSDGYRKNLGVAVKPAINSLILAVGRFSEIVDGRVDVLPTHHIVDFAATLDLIDGQFQFGHVDATNAHARRH